jgi:oligopeptide/dipeptide ABC transporter ATP-binding protein
MSENSLLLEVKNLRTYFYLREGTVRAVDGASFEIEEGRTLGIIGESGCGKSMTALSILRIVPRPGRIVEGQILLHRTLEDSSSYAAREVVDVTALDPRGDEIHNIRGKEIAMVFQEPMSSLTPVYTIGDQIMEAILVHQQVNRAEARKRAIEVLGRVGMPRPKQMVDQYPHQLSGGMRQRAMIAIALSCHPSLLIADEPTTALDVTTEAQILELMRDLRKELGMSILYITHNLGVVAEMVDEVVVMYLGRVVERADVVSLFHNPLHPYTRALLMSIPQIGHKSGKKLMSIKGIVPDPYSLPQGCLFHPRCPEYMEGKCDRQEPELLEEVKGHWVRCLLYT